MRGRLDEPRIDKLVAQVLDAAAGEINDQPGYQAAVLSLARRWQALDTEAADLAVQLKAIVAETAPPGLLELQGVGPDVAAALMIAAGDNPKRLRSEASLAALCGVSPLDCSSGKQDRHRLNRGGNRDANMALWRIVMVRLRWNSTTRAYIEKRVSEGKTRRGAMRCLKRYIACDVYRLLTAPDPTQSTLDNKRSIGSAHRAASGQCASAALAIQGAASAETWVVWAHRSGPSSVKNFSKMASLRPTPAQTNRPLSWSTAIVRYLWLRL